jgi:hypothetical protein
VAGRAAQAGPPGSSTPGTRADHNLEHRGPAWPAPEPIHALTPVSLPTPARASPCLAKPPLISRRRGRWPTLKRATSCAGSRSCGASTTRPWRPLRWAPQRLRQQSGAPGALPRGSSGERRQRRRRREERRRGAGRGRAGRRPLRCLGASGMCGSTILGRRARRRAAATPAAAHRQRRGLQLQPLRAVWPQHLRRQKRERRAQLW